MRKIKFTKDSFYKITNIGSNNQAIFLDDDDCAHMLFPMFAFQSPVQINNSKYYVDLFLKRKGVSLGKTKKTSILKNRYIEVLAFSIKENYFEIIVKNLKEDVLSAYIQRIQTSYSKYFNSKYRRVGHVFNGPFIAEKIMKTDINNEISRLHKKHLELKTSSLCNVNFDWSSYSDFSKINRWKDFLTIKK